ncbi:hypothetical protein RZS28_13435 [Methylocapsa polymorpha]|uniref:Uncharacterized protein n=1 Tax=Methylocapsa polymorpha TaxID=3080828 RepID=A0ABZ0HPR1_9HYPH|nr:hypothetical protein RZS28_13435 [Methylocapsa sp. RX1]
MAEDRSALKGPLQLVYDLVKASVAVVLGAIVIAVAVINFQPLCNAAQQLLAKAGDARELEIAGFKVSLSEDSVAEALAAYAVNPGEISAEVTKAIRALRPDEYERLLDVGQLDGLCEYERPSAKMRGDVALDYTLAEKGLTWIADSPDTLASVSAYLAKKAAMDQSSENGRALSCYDMTLTELGRNVKTGLVQSFKTAFDPIRDHSEPTPVKREMAQK